MFGTARKDISRGVGLKEGTVFDGATTTIIVIVTPTQLAMPPSCHVLPYCIAVDLIVVSHVSEPVTAQQSMAPHTTGPFFTLDYFITTATANSRIASVHHSRPQPTILKTPNHLLTIHYESTFPLSFPSGALPFDKQVSCNICLVTTTTTQHLLPFFNLP